MVDIKRKVLEAMSAVFGRAELWANYKSCKRCGARYPLRRVWDGYICMTCSGEGRNGKL